MTLIFSSAQAAPCYYLVVISDSFIYLHIIAALVSCQQITDKCSHAYAVASKFKAAGNAVAAMIGIQQAVTASKSTLGTSSSAS